jgi:AcrR family transcriptional regulator
VDRTKELILKAAYECFSEKGFLGTRTKEIAKRAGVSEVTLFRHFNSKRELFEEVLKKFSVLSDLERIKAKKGKGEELLKEVGLELLLSLKEKREFIKIILSEVALYPPEVSQIYRKFIERLDQLIAEILKKDPLIARAFHSCIFGYFLSEELFLKKELSEEELKEFVEKLSRVFGGEVE